MERFGSMGEETKYVSRKERATSESGWHCSILVTRSQHTARQARARTASVSMAGERGKRVRGKRERGQRVRRQRVHEVVLDG